MAYKIASSKVTNPVIRNKLERKMFRSTLRMKQQPYLKPLCVSFEKKLKKNTQKILLFFKLKNTYKWLIKSPQVR